MKEAISQKKKKKEKMSLCTSYPGFPSFILKKSNVMHTYHTQKAGLETTRALAVKYGDVRLIFLFFIGENNEKTKRGKRRKKAKNVVGNDGKE